MTLSAMKSIFAGVGGTLVLAVFGTTFLTIEKVLFIIPVFIAFNGAVTGYRVVEVLKDRLHKAGLFSFVMGIGGGAATFFAVNVAGRMMSNPFTLGLFDMAVYILVSGITSYLGAKLACRYFNL